MLDTAGTLIGVARQAGLLDQDGRLPRLRQALLADSGGAMLGAALGTSTTTAYIESAAGVEEGGRTGLTALVVAALFLASLFLAPLAQTVPPYATAPALLFVACLMATSLGAIAWDEPTEYIPALIIALMIPLSYSIATGIGLGFIAYVALKALAGRFREINAASAVIAARLPAQADLRLMPITARIEETSPVPTYFMLVHFTDQGIRNIKDTIGRAEAFEAMAEKSGVTIKELCWTIGRYDVIAVFDAPDDESAAALPSSASSLGTRAPRSCGPSPSRRWSGISRQDGLRPSRVTWPHLETVAAAP